MIGKYKLSDVAKDLGLSTKEVSDSFKEYARPPKSNSQVLSEQELNVVFDVVSQKRQIASLEQVFAPAAAAAEERRRQAEERIRAQEQERENQRREQERAREEAQTRQSRPQAQKRPETRTLEHRPADKAPDAAVQQEPVSKKQPKVH